MTIEELRRHEGIEFDHFLKKLRWGLPAVPMDPS